MPTFFRDLGHAPERRPEGETPHAGAWSPSAAEAS